MLDSLGLGAFGYVPFVVIISVLIFFHELGHFLVGRWCGVKIVTFSIGFGPELFGFDDRHGTHWRLAAIPLGGYVKFFGDANAASMPDAEKNLLMTPAEREVSLFHKPVWQRIAIVAAGPIANFILAAFVFAAAYSIYGYRNDDAVVGPMAIGSPADKAGLEWGDRILSVDGANVTLFKELPDLIGSKAGQTVKLKIERGGQPIDVDIVPIIPPQMDANGKPYNRAVIGIGPGGRTRMDPASALWQGTRDTGQGIADTAVFLFQLVAGKGSAKDVTGFVGIAVVSKDIAQHVGLFGLIMLTAGLSISVGFVNLLPIPILDGGHLVFYAIEAIRGRPVGPRAQELSFGIGLMLIITVTILVFGNDLTHHLYRGE